MTDEIRQALSDGHIDVAGGLTRCMDNEQLYLRLLKMFAAEDHAGPLRAAIENGNLEAAERKMHSLKGTSGNLSIMELYNQAQKLDQMMKENIWPAEELDAFFEELELVQNAVRTAEMRGA